MMVISLVLGSMAWIISTFELVIKLPFPYPSHNVLPKRSSLPTGPRTRPQAP